MEVDFTQQIIQAKEGKTLNKPFVVCCESGVRSAKAAKFLNLNKTEILWL